MPGPASEMTFWQAAHGMATIRGDGLSDVLDQTIEPGQHTVVCHFRYDIDLCEGIRPSVRLELDVPEARDGVPPRPGGRLGACAPGRTRPPMNHYPLNLAAVILPPLEDYEAEPSCGVPARWDAGKLHLLWVRHMSGCAYVMPDDCAPVRRWLGAVDIGDDLTGFEALVLNEWLEGHEWHRDHALRAETAARRFVTWFASCHLIECGAFTPCCHPAACAV